MQITFTGEELSLLKDQVLIIRDFYLSPEMARKLKAAAAKKGKIEIDLSADDLSALLDAVISQANHAKDPKIQEKLDALNEKLEEDLWSTED
jgi:hypothetical protein